eukprot:6212293-Pleurochrysis_carterae.AAC.5
MQTTRIAHVTTTYPSAQACTCCKLVGNQHLAKSNALTSVSTTCSCSKNVAATARPVKQKQSEHLCARCGDRLLSKKLQMSACRGESLFDGQQLLYSDSSTDYAHADGTRVVSCCPR